MTKRNSFVLSDKSNPHRIRAKKILENHPDIRKLIGKNPNTFIVIVGLVVLQVLLTCLVADQSWWIIFGAAYLVGAFIDHALFVMIHECAHRLLFKKPEANRLAGIFANMPQIFPSSVSFERYHIKMGKKKRRIYF
jgi:sphingolipid delta-4 desaturase